MKRLIIGLLFAVLTATGLVSVSTGSALADCPYTGCTDTDTETQIPNRIEVGGPIPITFMIDTIGSAQPRGLVFIHVEYIGTLARTSAEKPSAEKPKAFTWNKKVKYTGGREKIRTPKIKRPGKYKVVVRFKPRKNSVYGPSRSVETVRVTR